MFETIEEALEIYKNKIREYDGKSRKDTNHPAEHHDIALTIIEIRGMRRVLGLTDNEAQTIDKEIMGKKLVLF